MLSDARRTTASLSGRRCPLKSAIPRAHRILRGDDANGAATMGRLNYDGVVSVEIDDRALAHLQIVIASKLRRGEPFHFTWTENGSTGGGRTSIWVTPSISLTFTFYGSREASINRHWLDVLM
ncbi:MAG TPA: hypothetical protein VJR25_07580, partial [Microbacterium sp.]|uniref:DUF7882 family protein n=1 Tax=Microbacterium sp. TaxID=51671 RepID=UPI002B4733E5